MDRRIANVLLILLAIALARYVAVAFFVHPFADDFSYAVAGMHNELLKRLADEYQFWNGRWFSNILVLRGPLVLGMENGLWLYRLVPVALLAFTWYGAFTLIRSAMPPLGRSKAAIGSSIFLLLYLQLMPDLSEGIYWYTGAVSYQLPGALTLLLAAAWVKLFRTSAGSPVFGDPAVGGIPDAAGSPRSSGDPVEVREKKWRVRRLIPVVVLAVIICGCNELHMVYMVLLHAALLFFSLHSTKRIDRRVLLVLVVVVIAAAVMVLAPGNAGRASQFPHKHEVQRTVLWGGLQTGRFLLTWIGSPGLMIASLLYLMICGWVVGRSSVLRIATKMDPWRWALFTVAMVFISMVMPYWNTGLLGQHRTVNAALLFFLPCWFFFLTLVWIRWLRPRPQFSLLPVRYAPVASALLAVVVLFTGSGGRVSRDLLEGRMSDFDKQLRDRYTMIVTAEVLRTKDLALPAAQAPRSLRYLDGTSDPGHWINRSIAQYFASDSLRIAIGEAPSTATGPLVPR